MSWFRKNPLFAIAMTLCAAIALGELGLIYERFAASRAAAKKLEQRKVELHGMSGLTPPPTREVATAIEADLAKAQVALASMQRELEGRGAHAGRMRAVKTPAARTDAYFDLATFVERMRELARKQQVEVRPEAARFGFAVYANEGPEVERIEPVFHQRQIAQYLLEALLEAKPRALLNVRRGRTLTKTEREEQAAALASGEPPPEPEVGEDGPDYFTIDPQVSARVPGHVDTMPFRIAFIGQTAALRTFLNRLASFDLPVLVREVEVDAATAEDLAGAAPSEEAAPAEPAAEAMADSAASVVLTTDPDTPAPRVAAAPPRPRRTTATPIVTRSLSRFTVTVEFIELVTPAPKPATDESAPTPP